MNKSLSLTARITQLIKNEDMPSSFNVRGDSYHTAAQKHFGDRVPSQVAKVPSLNSSDHALSGGLSSHSHKPMTQAHSFLNDHASKSGSFNSSSGFKVDHFNHGGHDFLVQHEPETGHTNLISSTHAGMQHLSNAMHKPEPESNGPSITMHVSPPAPKPSVTKGLFLRSK